MSTHITGIRLTNWRCFAGEQELTGLRPLTYAIVAREANNPDRSNWLGKSSFLESIRFALTGELRKGETVEGWINNDAEEGAVDIELSDETFISRYRKRGSSTHLEVITPEGITKHDGDAQKYLNERFMNEADLNVTAFFEQKATDKFVAMTPAERTEVVVGWIGLAPLEEGEALVLSELSGLVKSFEDKVRECDRILDGFIDIVQLEGALENERKNLANARNEVEAANVSLREAQVRRRRHADWREAQQKKEQYQELQRQLAQARSVPTLGSRVLEDNRKDYSRRASLAAVEREKASRDCRELQKLAEGKFDGACPVLKGFDCPAKSHINSQRNQNQERLEKARVELSEKVSTEKSLTDELHRIEATIKREGERSAVISRLEGKLEDLQPYLELAAMPEPPNPSDAELAGAVSDAASNLAFVNQKVHQLAQNIVRYKKLQEELGELEEQVKLRRAAALILGRTGAQRRLSEAILGEITERCNAVLAARGIPLNVDVTWVRPGKKLEEQCHACGHFYGSSQRAKECPSCHVQRSPKMDVRLGIEISDSSGGSADIVGLMFQLSAARWLREARGMQWGTYCIDEPFGSLDPSNRRALASGFHSMMEQDFGARQAFVVAHDMETLESLPARIEIVSDGGMSKVRVQHG